MALVVLPAAFVLLWFLVWNHRALLRWPDLTRRGAFLLAYLFFETVLVAVTELSSIGHHFTARWVFAGWLLVTVGLLSIAWRDLAERTRPVGALHPIRRASRLGKTETTAWLLIPLFYLGVLVYLALAYLPSNGDSLDYHLARVEHWIQDQSVGPFPAHFTAQVDYSPLAEYNLAHFHLLLGSDRLDGFVQLFAAVVCVVAVSEIARVLGASRLVQVGAAVVCTTIPSLVLSATSTENNLFAASFGVCLIFVILAHDPLRSRWSFAIFVGLAASLAFLTKGTVVVLIGPVAAALLVWRIATETSFTKSARLGTGARIMGAIAVTAVIVAGPFLYQEETLFGSADGPDAHAVLSPHLTWRVAGANIVRSTAANFMMGNGRSGPETAVSKLILGKLHRVYDVFGVAEDNQDYFVGPDIPAYFDAFGARNFTGWDRQENEGADPLDVVLMVVTGASFVVLLVLGDRRMRVLVLMAGTLTIGYLVFAAMARWQIFGVRFYIPLFVAWSPLIAIALGRWSTWLLRLTMVVLAVACLPQLLDNAERPLVRSSYGHNPLAPYFLGVPYNRSAPDRNHVIGTADDVETLANVLKESTCQRLGIGSFIAIEYPVWVGLHDVGWAGKIQDVGVQNVTARYENPDFHQCAVLTQPSPHYVGTERGRVQIGFGKLALSILPEDIRTVRVAVDGFSSAVPGVRLFPGSGWSFTPSPTLSSGGAGSVYVYSPRAEVFGLRLIGPASGGAAGVSVSTPGAVRSHADSNANGLVLVNVGAGITEVGLTQGNRPTATPVVKGVRVVTAVPAPAVAKTASGAGG